MSGSSERFYDELAREYDDAILRCVPRYAEMLGAILGYVPADLRPRRVLELGAGSGHLTRAVLDAFPTCRVLTVDLSREMLLECRRRTDPARVEGLRADFARLAVAEHSFDLAVSSISIHHVDDTAKQRLFATVRRSLRPGGVFAWSDQFRGDTPEITAEHHRAWQQQARALGVDDREWARWMEHQDAHDHHATLREQIRWLEDAGFTAVDCVWRHLLWTVLVARRSPGSA